MSEPVTPTPPGAVESEWGPGQRFIRCSLCPDLFIPYEPGTGTLLFLWEEHERSHPAPKMSVTLADGSKAAPVGVPTPRAEDN